MRQDCWRQEVRLGGLIMRVRRSFTNEFKKEVVYTLGKTQSYISKIETGQLRVDVIQLEQFANLYKKKLEYFISK